MTAVVLRGDARCLPLPDASVDLVVTSPPYFGLRSYTDGGEHYESQIGSESTPQEWLAVMVECVAEMARVLKPSGSIFLNVGDKYAGSGMGGNTSLANSEHYKKGRADGYHPGTGRPLVDGDVRGEGLPVLRRTRAIVAGVPNKSLIGLPWRLALACTDQLGLILRRDIIWSKPNGLPESVTDRCRSSHEYLFHLTKSPRYYAAVDEIRETYGDNTHVGRRDGGSAPHDRALMAMGVRNDGLTLGNAKVQNPLGKLPGSVWSIPSQPLTVPAHLGTDHFAAFPMELPRRCILGWSPPGICAACGEGRRPVQGVDWSRVPHRMAERRALTNEERDEAAECFRGWQDASGIPSRAIAELFPSRTGGLTGCVANWRQGLNTMMPEQLDLIEGRFGQVPGRLRELVLLTRLLPVAEFDVGIGGAGTGRHRNRHSVIEPKGYRAITGYACACPAPDAPTRPSVILDPFGGTGTTALVASVLGRTGVSIDRSADYGRLARWRTTDPAERARAMQVPKPPPVPSGQVSLFDLDAS